MPAPPHCTSSVKVSIFDDSKWVLMVKAGLRLLTWVPGCPDQAPPSGASGVSTSLWVANLGSCCHPPKMHAVVQFLPVMVVENLSAQCVALAAGLGQGA